jgi:uncharacterized protein (TIRG00374 family)
VWGRRRLTIWIGLVISALFLYLALRNVRFDEIRRALSQVDLALLLLAALIFLVSFSVRAVRWRYILRPVEQIGLLPVFSLLSIGFMANNVLPARLGELVRAYFLARKTGIRKSLSLATILLERLSDFAALLLSALLVTLFFTMPSAVEHVGLVTGLIFLFFILLLILVHVRTATVRHLVAIMLSPLGIARRTSMIERVDAFIRGLLIVRTGRGVLWIFTLSLCVWGLWTVALHVALLAFHIDVPFSARLLILAVVNLGALIPSSPGYVGPYQYLCWVCLSIYGVEKSLAFSFSVVMHALWYVPLTCLGFVFLGKEHLSLSQIRSLEDDMASQSFPLKNGEPETAGSAPVDRGEPNYE